MKNKFKALLAIIIVAVIGAAYYFGYYVPRTPTYTLNLIRQGVDNHDPAAVFKQVDVDAIVNNAIDRELKEGKLANDPFSRNLVKLLKPVASSALKQMAAQKIKGEETHPDKTLMDGVVGALQDFTRSYHDDKKVKVKDLSIHIDHNNICTYTLTLENPATGDRANIQLLARQLDDGTWQIYDIPNIMDIKKLNLTWDE